METVEPTNDALIEEIQFPGSDYFVLGGKDLVPTPFFLEDSDSSIIESLTLCLRL